MGHLGWPWALRQQDVAMASGGGRGQPMSFFGQFLFQVAAGSKWKEKRGKRSTKRPLTTNGLLT